MSRMLLVRVSLVRIGDVVALPHISFSVQHVYKGGGRVSLITDKGFPLDFDSSQIVSVLRGRSCRPNA